MSTKPEKLDPFENGKRPMDSFSEAELADVELKIKRAYTSLICDRNGGGDFFGMIAIRLGREITDKDGNFSACTDYQKIYFNPGFVQACSVKELQFVVAHEIYHVIFEHFLRLEGRKPRRWNESCDYAINYLLVRDHIGTMLSRGLYDKKYADMASEQIYAQREKENAKYALEFDKHPYPTNGKDGDKQGKGSGIGLDADLVAEIRANIRDIVIQACHTSGNAPAEIKRMIDNFLMPKVSWVDKVKNTIVAHERTEVSYMRPNRKMWNHPNHIVLAGTVPGIQINVGIGIDNSGSISNDMLKIFLSEINGLMEDFESFSIKIWSFDTQVNGLKEFTQDNADELIEYQVVGGGGTHIKANFDFVEENSDELGIDLLILFTDLYDNLSGINPNFIDTLWIIAGNSEKSAPPFGDYCHYEDL